MGLNPNILVLFSIQFLCGSILLYLKILDTRNYAGVEPELDL